MSNNIIYEIHASFSKNSRGKNTHEFLQKLRYLISGLKFEFIKNITLKLLGLFAHPKPVCRAPGEGPCSASQLQRILDGQLTLKCDTDGYYAEVQCPEQWAECYCVDKLTGQSNGRTVHNLSGRATCVAARLFNFFGG